MRLRLTLEKALVPALAETGGGIYDELGVGRERDTSVASQVVAIWQVSTACRCRLRPDLKADEVRVRGRNAAPSSSQGFPIDALLVNAQAAPCAAPF